MSLFSLGRLGYAAVLGVPEFTQACARYAVKLALSARRVDDAVGEEMVQAMRADAPQVTGALVNGITTRREGDSTVVQASALRVSGGEEWDYAVFQEHGTVREVAEPFFYDNADEILGRRVDRHAAGADAAELESGF